MKALYYSCALAFFQQTSGINVVLFYAETIFGATGSTLPSSISTIIIGLVMASAAGMTAPAAKIFGIKNLLCISALGEAMSLVNSLLFQFNSFYSSRINIEFFRVLLDSISSYRMAKKTSALSAGYQSLVWYFSSLPIPLVSHHYLIIPSISRDLKNVFFPGFGPFVWVIMAEIFPAHLKAIASAVTASFCWLLCFILTRFFSVFTDNFGKPAAFWMFGILCVISLFFVIFQLPDTENKSFQEIQEMIHGKKKSKFSEQKA